MWSNSTSAARPTLPQGGIASAAGRLITGVCALDAGVPTRFALPAILAARVGRLLRFPVLGRRHVFLGKALGSPAGARTTRGVACTRIPHRAAPGTGSAAVRGSQGTQNVSLKASAPLLHVSRRSDSRLARRPPGDHRRRARLLMRHAASSLRKPRTGPSSHSRCDRLVRRYMSVKIPKLRSEHVD